MNLADLCTPFSEQDVEWRIARAGVGAKGIFCLALCYITARAVQQRFDAVCGPENWKLEEPKIIEVNGKSAFVCGLSIRVGDEWVTKWDVAEPTNIEPAKGGWSGAVKRAGAAWGCGRYLYHLDETFAEVVEQAPISTRSWNYAKLPKDKGGREYYWKAPGLPAWALPKEPEHEVSDDELGALKQAWRLKFAQAIKSPKDLREGFARFVTGVVGEFPSADSSCWTKDALERCQQRITETTDPAGVSSDVPFE